MNRLMVLNPRFWFMVYELDLEYDKFLNQSMDEAQPIEVLNAYEFRFNGKTIWMRNYPYACFTSRLLALRSGIPFNITATVRPKRVTIIRMMKYIKSVDKGLYEYILNEI